VTALDAWQLATEGCVSKQREIGPIGIRKNQAALCHDGLGGKQSRGWRSAMLFCKGR
jgi:hypothetical protein